MMTELTLSTPLPSGRRAKTRSIPWLAVSALAIAIVLSIPLLSVVSSVLHPATDTWHHLADTVLGRYVSNTLQLLVLVGAGVVILGVSTAWLVTMTRFPGSAIFEWALILPLAVPAYVMAYAYTDALQFSGPVQTALRAATGWTFGDYWFPEVRSLGGAAIMLSFVLYPYVFLMARAAFLEQSVCALEVGRTLGCGPWGAFWRIGLPLARPAIAGGTALALMETLADFGTVSYFGVPTFTTGIYRTWLSLGDRMAAAQLATVLLSFVAILLLLEAVSRRRARYHHTTGKYNKMPRTPLKPAAATVAFLVCMVPILVGFAIPAGVLFSLALSDQTFRFGGRFSELAVNSFVLAGLTALVAVVLATIVAYGRRLFPRPIMRIAHRLSGLGYAIPGSIIAIGVLLPFASFERAVDDWTRATFGVSTGLWLTGTIVALVFAYLVRFLAVSGQAVEASLSKITPNMDAAARSLGATPARTVLSVHAPLMLGSLLTAGLVVFVDVMKELPATLIVRPFNFDTLAVQAFTLAADERLSEAAAPALAIVAVGLLPVVLLSRTISRSRPGGARSEGI